MKRYALITDEGTAADETCLCENHNTETNRAKAYKNANPDVNIPNYVDVTENTACKCSVCGK